MARKVVELTARRPRSTPTEAELRRLEDEAEAAGRGLAGDPPRRGAAEALERPDVQTSKRPDVQAEAGGIVRRVGRPRADGTRAGARTLRRMTVYLPPDLATRAKVAAAAEDRPASDLIAEALERYLAG